VKAYVTGATGFVGSHVAAELRAQGADVRDERIDLLDRGGIERAIEGCDAVFHVAALYSYSAPADQFQRVNVEGTRVVAETCRAKRVRRLVHTSTAGTCGPVPGRDATEEDGPPAWELAVPYKRTKLAAEQLVLGAAGEGLDVVVVNPTTPVGPGDAKPTPTGRMIAGVARGRIRAYLSGTGLNVVDVRDVARGHVLAHEKGTRGERYILGGENVSLQELFARIARLAGRRPPRLRVPYAAAQAAAALRLANQDEVRLARVPMYFTSEKARSRLGYAPAAIDPALELAVREALGEKGGA
jgi:dihydroflavonol-4-reductase